MMWVQAGQAGGEGEELAQGAAGLGHPGTQVLSQGGGGEAGRTVCSDYVGGA